MTRDEDLDWNHGFGTFEHDRPRDPSWLNEVTAVTRRGEYDRAECCHDRAAFLCEIPRSRQAGGKSHEMPPARLRLCAWHANILLASDELATIHPIGRPSV